MPSQIAYPREYEIAGVFLLGREELAEVDEVLKEARKEMDRQVRAKITREVNQRLKDPIWTSIVEDEDVEGKKKEWREAFKKRYRRKRDVSVVCRSKKTVHGKTFADIFETDGIENELPTRATIRYQNEYDSELAVDMFVGVFSKNNIRISASEGDAVTQRFARRLRDWAESKRRVPWWPKSASIAGFIGAWFLFMCLPLATIGLFETVTEKTQLFQRAAELSDSGIDAKNQAEAIEILLRLQTGHFKETKKFGFEGWYIAWGVAGAGLVAFGVLCPQSTLGIGRSEQWRRFYLWEIRLVTVSIGLWLAAIITSFLASAIYDLIARVSSQP